MKKILVPTDFSELAENALKYAAQLAKRTDAELLLLHVYTIPVFTENPILMNDNQYLEEQAIRGLEEAKQSVEELNSGLKVSFDAESREYNGRWYTDLKAYAVQIVSGDADGGGMPPVNEAPMDSQMPDDDLPF